MDKLTHYRHTIQEIIKKYYDLSNSQPATATETKISDDLPDTVGDRLIIDEQRDQYLWLCCGWDGKKRVQHIILYLQIQNGKIWIEEDSTNLAIVDEMLVAGIPQTDIILGFHHPSKRGLTEFAIA
ncbi:fdxN element excision controlling factor XisI [Trichormus variabilis ATCC 29413]|uniref:FdxN element excision controlling factor XisI n=3 Tax=Anabaena variabilis TaxID=264691 RepID=Q3MD55_TRIV2|nr:MULTISPECIES: XisI protein [Nostocaceae]ABA21081.1 fdxN element excision controlling factor XisI [Trichormus variabilis ATCC 29413]MBC1215779.1 XisI protein [Trichormus variabilis ARAD]MBC1257742.1 XisI protein [Trichormus variabilis V5]MBC1269263.1 XisI protein [Trichormus variabilis FSR]MBC1302345.1 XisI protein [Trichormus variabilis N2B]